MYVIYIYYSCIIYIYTIKLLKITIMKKILFAALVISEFSCG